MTKYTEHPYICFTISAVSLFAVLLYLDENRYQGVPQSVARGGRVRVAWLVAI